MEKIRDRLDLVFDGHVPSKKNSLRRIMRGGRMLTVPSEQYLRWEKESRAKFAGLRSLDPPYAITARYYPGRLQKFDMGNAQESIHDLLVTLDVISDDNLFELQSFTCELAGLEQGAERVEVSIVSLEPTEFDERLRLLRDKDALKSEVASMKGSGQKTTQKSLRERLWGLVKCREVAA